MNADISLFMLSSAIGGVEMADPLADFLRELATETRQSAAEKDALAEQLRREAARLRQRAETCEEMAELSQEDFRTEPPPAVTSGELAPTASAVQYAATVLGKELTKPLEYAEIAERAKKLGYNGFNPGTAERVVASTFLKMMRGRPDVFLELPDRPIRFTLACGVEEAFQRLLPRRASRTGRRGKWAQEIVAYIRENGPSRWTDLVQHTGAPNASISKALQKPYFKAVSRGVWDIDEEAIEKLGEPT